VQRQGQKGGKMLGTLIKSSWRNTWRNKRRTYFTLSAIAVGVMSLIFVKSYFGGILNSASAGIIKNQVGHIRIAHKEFLRLERIMPREYLVTGVHHLETLISRLPGVELILPRLKFNAFLSAGDINEAGIAVGIDPGKADKTMELSRSLVQGRCFGATGQELIIGKTLARKLKVAVQDEILLVTTDINYSTYALPFRVTGIFATGYSAVDKHVVYIPLSTARQMLDCGDSAQDVLVYLQDPAAAVATGAKITALLEKIDPHRELQAIPWQENDLVATFIPYAQRLLDYILKIFMLMVALVILNTMLMTVMERYHEIGIIKALGCKDREVVLAVMAEAVLLGGIGAVAGGILGGTVSAVLEKTGIDLAKMAGQGVWEKLDIPIPFLNQVIHPEFTLSILVGSMVFGILATAAAALYPAYKSFKMSPVEAIRSQLKV
jgi:putative ABC transport system permease protein